MIDDRDHQGGIRDGGIPRPPLKASVRMPLTSPSSPANDTPRETGLGRNAFVPIVAS